MTMMWRTTYGGLIILIKPKRKALPMQGAKVWKRKLHYKRSLRPMRTAERLMKNLHKETDDEEADEIEKRRQKGKRKSRKKKLVIHRKLKSKKSHIPVLSLQKSRRKKKREHMESLIFLSLCLFRRLQ